MGEKDDPIAIRNRNLLLENGDLKLQVESLKAKNTALELKLTEHLESMDKDNRATLILKIRELVDKDKLSDADIALMSTADLQTMYETYRLIKPSVASIKGFDDEGLAVDRRLSMPNRFKYGKGVT